MNASGKTLLLFKVRNDQNKPANHRIQNGCEWETLGMIDISILYRDISKL